MAEARAGAGQVREWEAPFDVDVRLTLSVHGRGRSDPTFRIGEVGAVWRTSLTPEGPGTLRVTRAAAAPEGRVPGERPLDGRVPATTRVIAHAWGPGACWLLDALECAADGAECAPSQAVRRR